MPSLRHLFDAPLSQHARLVRIDTALPDAALVVERFSGREAISELFRFEVDCLSGNAHFELKTLLGEEVTLRLRQADGTLRHWHGHVTEALNLGADGGLARYRLIIEPWLAFCAQRRDCFQFQDLDVLGIAEALFADYPMADWRAELTQPLRRYSRVTQYRETDFDFLRRLLAEEGLSWRFEHDQSAAAGDEATHARHRWVIFDREADAPACAQATIRFHRNDAPEREDSIQTLRDITQVVPNAVTRSSWDYKKLTATGAQALSALDMGEVPPLEIYDASSAYRFEDAEAARLRTDLLLSAFESEHRRLAGEGAVRRMAEGTTFTLLEHDQYRGDEATLRVLSVEHHAANNLGADAAELLKNTDLEHGTYRNRFVLQHASAPVVPLPIAPPRVGPQSALVVGHPEAALTTDRDHRVKIQYPWQRGSAPNRGGLTDTGSQDTEGNAPGDAGSGTWVRVAEWLAGPNWGSHFLPRIGTEVLVDFIDGDIDRPIIVGQLYNGDDLPPFSAGVDSGANHPGTVSGWHSHNHEAGVNQWLTDDAPGQLRTRLATSETEAQLGLGHLIDQRLDGAHRGPWRGTGFELRTDGWLAVRAGEGLLISATARQNATGTQMDVAEAVGQLRAAERTAQALSEAASAQGALALNANKQQTEFIDSLDPAKDGTFDGSVGGQEAKKAQPGSRTPGEPTERFATPTLVTEGPDDIGLSTPASTVLFASQHVHATVHEDLHIASAKTYATTAGEAASLFTHSGGIKSIAAAGSHTIQAHTDEMEILADESVTVTSSNDEIHILAKDTIVLKAGQSSVTLKGGDITFACPGTFSVKGAGNAFEGPGRVPAKVDDLPTGRIGREPNWLDLELRGWEAQPIKHTRYLVTFADGSSRRGTLDANGYAHLEDVPEGGKHTVEYENPDISRDPEPYSFDDLKASIKAFIGA
ncbi:type VI secretion system tip protein VgrG [Nitrogeniibacter mangrovi]|uniref:Type VI secretion system tip protein VgrG n=1 Tax=Nitrogeniibacter mangrovi TaxID=2016596 RepID=A0A6C1B6Y6_9RHOO|nr:type VI secretion system Vgr family protein [Nitrogeniibacter mangrovi]QID19237.1 type VI secretion system tip protein VgrG [Nitrogeniibacter mangrovi]